MRKFTVNITFLLLSLIIIFFGYLIYYKYTFLKINWKAAENSIFFWGDSQTEAGFDLNYIKKNTGMDVYSAAIGGAGVIDFLVFTETVPDNSKVYVSLSPIANIRERDKNMSGIPVNSLYDLFCMNYAGILPMIRNNFHPRPIFEINSSLYPYKDAITFHEPLSKFENMIAETNNQKAIKQELFIRGLERLNRKNCHITFVQFPYNKLLSPVLSQNKIQHDYLLFIRDIRSLYENFKIDTINFRTDKRMMYDLSHLNEFGAQLVSEAIFKNNFLPEDNITRLFVINGGVCE